MALEEDTMSATTTPVVCPTNPEWLGEERVLDGSPGGLFG
jgi:hypothetical protein